MESHLVRFAVEDYGVFDVSGGASVFPFGFVVGVIVAEIFAGFCEKGFEAFDYFGVGFGDVVGFANVSLQIVELGG